METVTDFIFVGSKIMISACASSSLAFCMMYSTCVKRWEAKIKGENERYTHLNAEFQRIARIDKKAFLNEQYKKQKKKREREKQ